MLAIVSALIGGIIALLSAIISGFFNIRTSKAQIAVAKINSDKELLLQREKTRNENGQKRTLDISEKLLEVHVTASKMAREYSQTRSHFDWTDMVHRTEFRNKYIDDCNDVNKSIAITDVYLAEYNEYRIEIRDNLSMIYNSMNMFWGNQEELLRNHEIENAENRERHKGARITAIIEASNKISKHAASAQRKIVEVVALIKKDQDAQQR